jgi:carboxyl-terminal processing protease
VYRKMRVTYVMRKPLRRFSAWIAALVLTATALAVVSATPAPAASTLLPPGAVAPTDNQRAIARKVGAILEQYHYRHATIDGHFSSQVYDRYLDFLDGQRSYFLASDVAEFEPWRMRFDDMIHTGEIDPAYLIFARFQERNRQRIRYALSLLKTEPDWTRE